MRPNVLIACLFTTLCTVACVPPGEGRFTIDSALEHGECFGRAFPFEPVFLTSRSRTDSVGIFLQSRGGSFQFVDVVSFEVFQPNGIETGRAYPIDPIATRESMVVGGIELSESCPEVHDPLSMEGTVEFSQWSTEIDGIVEGTVSGQIRSLDTGEVVAEGLAGEFTFTVQVGQPYEEFRN